MSSFTITCPHCRQSLEADETLVGETLPCPACGKSLFVAVPVTKMTASSPALLPETPRKKPRTALWIGLCVLLVAAVGGGAFALKGASRHGKYPVVSVPERETRTEPPPKPRTAKATDIVPDDSSAWARNGTELRARYADAKMDRPFSFGPPTHHVRFEVKIDGTLDGKRLEDSSAWVIVHGRTDSYAKTIASVNIQGGGFTNDRTKNALLLVNTKNTLQVPIRGLFANPAKWITVDIEFMDAEVVFRFNKQTFKVPGLPKGATIWKIEFGNGGMNVSIRNVTCFPDAGSSKAPQTAEERCLEMATLLAGSRSGGQRLLRKLTGNEGVLPGMDDEFADYLFWGAAIMSYRELGDFLLYMMDANNDTPFEDSSIGGGMALFFATSAVKAKALESLGK